MSNIISFLENVGRDAVLRHATQGELSLAMERERIDPVSRAAILDQDRAQIDSLLGTTRKIFCLNFPVKTPKRAPPAPDKKPSKAPGKKPGKAPSKKPAKAPSRKATKGTANSEAVFGTKVGELHLMQ